MCFSRAAHLDVKLLELLQVEDARGAVLEEALVPLLQLGLIELRAFSQVVQDFRGQLTVVFPHRSSLLKTEKEGLGGHQRKQCCYNICISLFSLFALLYLLLQVCPWTTRGPL